MRLQCFRKIWDSFLHKKPFKKQRKGAMTLISSLLFLVFSIMGLSMLYFSQIYLKIGSFKKNSFLLEYSTENGIKQGFHQLTHLIQSVTSPMVLSTERTEQLKTDAKDGGIKTVEELLDAEIPLSCTDAWDNLQWKAQTHFSVKRFEDVEDYFRVLYDATILSEGKVTNFRQNRISSLFAAVEVWAGHLPLSSIPFLLDKKMTLEEQLNFRKDHAIEMAGSQTNVLGGAVSFSPEELLPKEAAAQISKALKIQIFQPQDLSQAKLRQAIGLEPGNEPIPAGVYLIKDDLGLGGIFVEGDLDEMVLAIDHGSQVVAFRSQAGQWILGFNPTECETAFIAPGGTEHFNLVPLGIIIIDGAVHSLGGGTVDESGSVSMVKNEEIPCILRGVDLTIISSEKITLSSHLIHEGVKWEDGVPYIKDSDSQLQIFATGQDIQGDGEGDGQIIIAADSPEELKIQASLTASGKGVTIEGENKSVCLLGSIQTSSYESNGNLLRLTFDERFGSDDRFLENAPKSSKPIMRVTLFSALEWHEY